MLLRRSNHMRGQGHASTKLTIRFHGRSEAGWKVLHVCIIKVMGENLLDGRAHSVFMT